MKQSWKCKSSKSNVILSDAAVMYGCLINKEILMATDLNPLQ